MKITILDAKTLGADADLSPLFSRGALTAHDTTASEQMRAHLADAEVCVVNKLQLGEKELASSSIRLILEAATGYDNIDLDYCRKAGIAVCNVPGYSTESVAQLTLAMALSLIGHIPAYRDFVHSGAYSAQKVANCLTPVWHELKGLSWGIVGGGNIGGRVGELASAFGCKVTVFRRKKDEKFENTDLDTLLSASDIISVHLPLNEQTRGLISAEKIALMKKNALFINVARGAITDEAALAKAVLEGKIGGLGVDVFSAEPFGKTHPFYALLEKENVLLTPHTAWGSLEARNRCVREMGENLAAFLKGEKRNRVD